ncbi:fimbrillin family protein [uncultured Treponema sp.]|uniref:fimbrillin family protein n=1 Tax=uncultured Treponema sp. TaxID=162155 RepID=UPI0025E81B6C|nr:fimbrillin family protein [uncultured Treponema sp.]
MKHRIPYLFAAAVFSALFLGCQYNDVESAQGSASFPEDGVIRFTTNLVEPTQARASITGSDLNQNGQQFQVKIVNPTSATYSYFNTVQYDGCEWTPVNRMLWQNDQQSITVTAAYKQGKTFSDYDFICGANLTVAADQSTAAKLKQQDLLTMPTKTIANPSIEETLMQNGKLVVNFYHALSKLDVTLDLSTEFFGTSASDVTDFTISGTNVGYNFNPMETANENYGTVTATGSTSADILPYQSVFNAATDADMHSTAKYEAIVVPQEIAAGALTVSFKIGTRSFSWTNTESLTFEQGKCYTLPLTVGSDSSTSLSPSAGLNLSSTDWLAMPGCYVAE